MAEEVTSNYARMGVGAEEDSPQGRPFNLLYIKSISFKFIARRLSIGVVLALFILPFVPGFAQWSTYLPDFAGQMLVAASMGTLELPFCFGFVAVCRRLQVYLQPFERYLLRGVLYILFGVSLALINTFTSGKRDWLNWLFVGLIFFAGIMYILAFLNGENAETGTEHESESVDAATRNAARAMASADEEANTAEKEEKERDDKVRDLKRAAMRAAMSMR